MICRMNVRDLEPLDWREVQRPEIAFAGPPGSALSEVTLAFADPVTREWYAEWLRSHAGWTAFTTWASRFSPGTPGGVN